MFDLVKLGAMLTFFGFLAVGSSLLYLGVAPTPSTAQEILEAQQAAKSWEIVQGVGWIVAGFGLATALFGTAKSDTAIDTKSEILLGRMPQPLDDTKREPKFVCSECGGDISQDAEVCPHCGERITG